MKNICLFIGCIVCLFSTNTQAQTIENVVFEFDGERISITYDLNHSNAGQKFTISLYSSHNNYQKPIVLLTGDVGDNILPGKQKKVMWDVRNELPPYFDDELSIKVKAILIEEVKADIVQALGYQIQTLKSIAYKRGGEIKIQWEGGASSDRIKIDLLKNNVIQQSLTQTNNTQSYLWEIPKNYKTGSSYSLRISSAINPGQKTTSTPFKIKPRMPLVLKVIPGLAVGVLVGILAGGIDNGGEPNDQLSDLPGPVKPN